MGTDRIMTEAGRKQEKPTIFESGAVPKYAAQVTPEKLARVVRSRS